MSQEFYKILHLGALFFVFASLGGMVLARKAGGTLPDPVRKLASITHGIAILVVLVAGFGLLKFIGLSNPAVWPGWVWAKLAIWLFFGAALVLVRKKPSLFNLFWVGFPLLGVVAAWLAFAKPF